MKLGDRIKIVLPSDEDVLPPLQGQVTAFIPGYAPHSPAALVLLDSPITAGGVSGCHVVMELRYENVSWEVEGEPGSQTVSLDLYAQAPSYSPDPHVHHVPLQTHAIFEVLPNAI